jgi:DNA (cytosine-5)-methyltransferase 1
MRVLDLFSGCGGLSLGFQNAGFEIVAAFDNWKPAIEIYKANFNHEIIEFDLSNVENYDIFKNYKPDIIIGGPPCQDFSSAGKRDETNGRADLTINYAEIISNVRPFMFVMENVERITVTKTLQKAKEIYKNCGYGLTSIVLDASLCGVPQLRKRFFLIGVLNGQDNELELYLEKNQAQKPMSIFDYLGNSLGTEHYYRHPRSYMRRGIFSIYEPSPTIRGVNRPIPKTYQFHEGDTCKSIDKVRPLTTAERSYIQTFPKEFKLSGAKTDLEQVIGNAVPVKLGEFVANSINEYLVDRKNNTIKIKPKKQAIAPMKLLFDFGDELDSNDRKIYAIG